MVCMVIAYNLADLTAWEGLGPEVAEFQTFSFSLEITLDKYRVFT